MKILTFTTLYPNNIKTGHGIFIEQRLRHFLKIADTEAVVVAPVPWFPFSSKKFGEYAAFAKVARNEERHGIRILHPRYPLIPKVGMVLTPFFMVLALYPVLKKLLKDERFDVIDAHYFYPDGVAAAMLGKLLGKPVTITARGSDITFIPQLLLPRKMIQWAAGQAAAVFTVCQALQDELISLGADPDKVTSLRNGVDLALFHPQDREPVRRQLNVAGPTLLSVGNLIELKGHYLIIEALQALPEYNLLIAGSGPDLAELTKRAEDLQVADRVAFLGRVAHDELVNIYSAADILILASSREGWANVLLEAMACGTPAIATKVWGTAEVVGAPAAGLLIEERSAQAIAKAVREMEKSKPTREETRAYAEQFSWDDTISCLHELFKVITAN